jgi:hypothetical protein
VDEQDGAARRFQLARPAFSVTALLAGAVGVQSASLADAAVHDYPAISHAGEALRDGRVFGSLAPGHDDEQLCQGFTSRKGRPH